MFLCAFLCWTKLTISTTTTTMGSLRNFFHITVLIVMVFAICRLFPVHRPGVNVHAQPLQDEEIEVLDLCFTFTFYSASA